MRVAVRVLGAALACFVGAVASAATLTVTNAFESGAGSLRQAILDSNASPGTLDTIAFDIPGVGPFAILLSTGSLIVTDPVVIDGTTQPGYAGLPLYQIRQGLFNGAGLVLAATAGGSTVRGLAFADLVEGIRIEGDGNTIASCFFGTNLTGTLELGNGIGVNVVNADGNLIGGTTAASQNLISGNAGFGIKISGSGNLVRRNLIGTKLNGDEPLGNQIGVQVSGGSNNVVGGLVAGSRNVISGNTWGIEIAGSADTLIQGNLIGTSDTGLSAVPNESGIQVSSSPTGLVIGGTAAAARNILSGNGYGIFLAGTADGTIIRGNSIGLDFTGDGPLGNDTAIFLGSGVTDTLVGGIGAGEPNHIAFNGNGVWNLGARTTIRGNSIHDNELLGIDQQTAGPSPNGIGQGQEFPLIGTVEISSPQGSSVRVQGILVTTSGNYTLDFYANPPCAPDPREFLEGETWLGTSPLTVAGGSAPFDVILNVSVEPGSRISATATDSTGRTSEFSQRLPFTITPSVGPGAGGTDVEVLGTNFEPGMTATIGGVPMTIVGAVFSFFFDAKTPALPGGVYDVTVTNPSGRTGTIPRGWIAEFSDVPPSHQFYQHILTLVTAGITAGVGGGTFGADQPTLRQQMAVFLLKAKHGICYVPPSCTGVFSDVPCPSAFASWIEALAAQQITGGCGTGIYCPANPVRRDQMAVFLLKAKYGPTYVPSACTGTFGDVACPSPFADWIEQLAFEQITGGCGGGNYCPLNNNTRGQMAVFLVRTFGL